MSAVETIRYGLEPIDGLWEELEPLTRQHYDEIEHFKVAPLEPHREAYAFMQSIGCLRVFTARADGRLIGYAFFVIPHDLHCRSRIVAHDNAVFVTREHRRGVTGLKLLKYAHSMLKAEGVQVIQHCVKRAHPKLGKILETMGFEPIETIYGKEV